MIGCLNTSLERIGGDMSAEMTLAPECGMSATMERRGTPMTFSMGLVCSTGLGPWEILYASDGGLITIDGGVLFVRKENT